MLQQRLRQMAVVSRHMPIVGPQSDPTMKQKLLAIRYNICATSNEV